MRCFSPNRRLSLVALCLVLLLFGSGICRAAVLPKNPDEIAWNLSALMVTYDQKRDLYIAEEDVVIKGGATRLEADYVEFSNKTKDAFAQGNVLLISGEDSISCNAMQINLATEKGFIHKGTIFIQKNNFYIQGENIRKTGQFTFTADKGSITSCSGDTPDWKITGKDVRVTIEGYGYANHATLWAKKMPALYSPYLTFPVKTKRQSGLLLPRISSSDRLGFQYEQPLFWAINRNSDATLYTDYMSDRGVKVGAEYRYILNDRSKGILMFDFLEDDKIDDGTDATKNYRYSSTPQRTNTDRYWLRMKGNHALPNGFDAKLDIDWVSDADYLLEFRDGFTGYDDTNFTFEQDFGRDLDEYDDTTRENSLTVSKSWSNYSLITKALWYDDVEARRENTDDTTLQTLPSVEFDASRQQLGNTGLYYKLDSEFRSFYRQDTVDTVTNDKRKSAKVTGQRMDLYPTLYYPIKLGKAFSLEPYIAPRGTLYHTDDYTDLNGDDDDVRTRAMYDVGAALSTTLSRVFTLNNGFADKVKHQVDPKLSYQFLPNVIQDDLPYFDSLDEIDEENKVTWSLTNSFIARNTFVGNNGTSKKTYREFAWLKLYQDYDIKNERDGDDAEDRPWSDITLETELKPFSYFYLEADLKWSPYNTHFNELNVAATVSDARGDKVTTAYRYTIEDDETWVARLKAQLTQTIAAYYAVEMDLEEEDTIETRTGIILNKECWGLALEYKEESADKSIAFMITLRGIGEFGSK